MILKSPTVSAASAALSPRRKSFASALSPSKRLTAAAVAAALTLAACGGGDSNEVGAESPTVASTTEQPAEPTEAPAAQEPEAPEPVAQEPEPSDTTDGNADGTVDGTAPEAQPTAEAQPEPEPEVDRGNNELPDVVVLNVATGEEVNLRSMAPADSPIVLWFYAPH